MTIYNIVSDFYALKKLANEALTDTETGEVREFTDEEKTDFLKWVNECEGNLEDKFNNIYKIYRNLKALSDIADAEKKTFKEEVDRLSKRAKTRENEAIRVKSLFAYAMEKLGMKKYKTPLFSIGWQNTRKCAKPIDGFFHPEDIPLEFLRVELSNGAINKAIETGRLYEKEGDINRTKLFYFDKGEEKELKGVAYSGGETLVIR